MRDRKLLRMTCMAPTVHQRARRPGCPRGQHQHPCRNPARYEVVTWAGPRRLNLCFSHLAQFRLASALNTYRALVDAGLPGSIES